MNEVGQYDFCPKCGALVRDGICQSCGYQIPGYKPDVHAAVNTASPVSNSPSQNGQPQYNGQQYNPYSMYQPQKKSNNKVWIGIAIGGAIFLFLAIFAIFALIFGLVMTGISKEEKESSWEEMYPYEYDDNYEYDYDDYFYDDYDDYFYDEYDWDEEYDTQNSDYYEFANEIRTDLEYSVDIEYEDSAGNSEESSNYILSHGSVKISGVPNEDALNEALTNEVMRAKKSYSEAYLEQSYDYFYSVVEPYVTYMDENVCSVVFIVYEYYAGHPELADGMNSWISCVNMDVRNGVVLDNTSLREMDAIFAEEFKAKSYAQNGNTGAEDLSVEEILCYLTSEENLIIFYTPLGVEIGICFEGEDGTGNWVTVTYKEESV